jgi:hypothetical protein
MAAARSGGSRKGRCPRRWSVHRRGQPDISRADFTFCLLALDWGFGAEETAERLMEESGKAYARRTAGNAAAALERRRGRPLMLVAPDHPVNIAEERRQEGGR